MENKTKFNSWHIVAAALGFTMLQYICSQPRQIEAVPYSKTQHYLESGQVEEMVVTETHIYGLYKLPFTDARRRRSADRVGSELAKDLAKYNS